MESVKKDSEISGKITTPEAQKFKCTKCDEEYTLKKHLRKHILDHHPIVIECGLCDESFAENWKYEVHVATHEKEREFCFDRCDHRFYSRWRLEKNRQSHDDKNQKCCHYYNNGKPCPYEFVGCKFKHEVSKNCINQGRCYRKLCQFRHRHEQDNGVERNKVWKCTQLNWSDEPCAFASTVKVRYDNHTIA